MFFSNLAGSLLGIIGTVGFFMSTIEGKLENIKKSRDMKHNFNQILQRRDNMLSLDFNEKSITAEILVINSTHDNKHSNASIYDSRFESENLDHLDLRNITTIGIDNTDLYKPTKVVPL
jgi:hypothetical protein